MTPARALASVIIFSVACRGESRPPDRVQSRPAVPSIVLVSIDTLRADHVGVYGSETGATPTLDALAREGVVFLGAMTPVPVTLPAHVSMLTGLLPHRHGVRDNGLYRLPADVPVLAAMLRDGGYDTGAVVAAAVLDRQYGIDRGFRRYDDRVGGGSASLAIAERPASVVTDAALAVAADLKPPFFLFVHYYDPHAAYRAPSPWSERFAKDPYVGEIAYTDDQIGRLRRELFARGLAKDSVFVVTSDHGEGLGEHGEATHGPFLYQSTLRIPLIASAPGRWPAGRRIEGLVSNVDVMPTLLALGDLKAAPGLDGRDLGKLLLGEAPVKRSLPLETEFGLNSYGWAPLAGITDGRFKWIQAPEPELYDFSTDPGEAMNLAAARLDEVLRLETSWAKAVTEDRRALAVGGSDAESAERLARLQSLGYVAGSPARRTEGLPDPKKAIGSLELVNEARRLIGERRYDDAIARLAKARRDSPRNLSALVLTGVAELQAGRPQAALVPLRRAAEVAPANADAPFNTGLALLALGDGPGAEKAFRRTLELAPRYHDAAVNLVDLLLQTDKPKEARAAYESARKAGLESPLLDFLEGKLAFLTGAGPAARAPLTRALQSGALPPPAAAEAQRMLGMR